MKISLEWLSQFLPGELSGQTEADALTNGGLPVEVIEQVGDDTVIDVEVTSNRSDCLCHVGVARELGALLNREFKEPAPPVLAEAKAGGLAGLRIEAQDLCPQYIAQVICNVKIGPSPAWMQRRLAAVGLRPINNVVDVTNYVMFELGQPLHAFDFDRITGREVVVRQAAAGEKITSIDGHQRTLTPGMLVIADTQRPIALAGVMGGQESEVSDGTTNILLESARFDPLCIRTTARALAMGSDSSYRFERGLDPALPLRASRRAAQLILETAGGNLAGPLVEAGNPPDAPRKSWLRLAKLQQVLGVELPGHAVVDALARLQLSPVLRGERIDVTVPTYRLDINSEIDLVEEVARVVGYHKIPERETIHITVKAVDPLLKTTDILRSTLVAGGYYEAVTFSFVTDSVALAFLPGGAAGLPRVDPKVRKADAQLRPSILPGLLEALRRNESAGTSGAKLFEIGGVFWNGADGKIAEKRTIGFAGGTDFRTLRGVAEMLLLELDANRSVTVKPASHPGFAAGACGDVYWGDVHVGHIGQVDRAISQQIGLRESPMAGELDLLPLLEGARHVPQLHPLARFPAVRRDLSLIVPEAKPYEELATLIQNERPAQLEEVEYVTTYRGKPLLPGSKSVTITLVFRSSDSTLTSEAVEGAVQKVITAAKEKLGATLRT